MWTCVSHLAPPPGLSVKRVQGRVCSRDKAGRAADHGTAVHVLDDHKPQDVFVLSRVPSPEVCAELHGRIILLSGQRRGWRRGPVADELASGAEEGRGIADGGRLRGGRATAWTPREKASGRERNWRRWVRSCNLASRKNSCRTKDTETVDFEDGVKGLAWCR